MTKPDCLGRENSRVLTKKWPSYFIKAYLLYDIALVSNKNGRVKNLIK